MTAPARLEELSPAEIHRKMRAGSVLLVDVREPQEHQAERIEGAVLAPLSTFDPKKLPDAKGREIVFHCGSGKRSATAVGRCLEQGLSHNAHMTGGIQAWKAAGLPTKR